MNDSSTDEQFMQRALQLAQRGEGRVEPNPMVGAVLAQQGRIVGEGFHGAFGGPHAEVEALRNAGANAKAATMYVTLEPCCHSGKTPPCTQAILQAEISRVVVAVTDPFAEVAGTGIAQLRQAGIGVEVGLCEEPARALIAPYLKLIQTGRPWVIAKWAMTLDGKIATVSGESRWISNSASRQVAHRLRGRVDAILVGRGTAEADDPLLTARPPGTRTATRVVLDSDAVLAATSHLVRTAHEVPVLVASRPEAPAENVRRLTDAGVEVFPCAGSSGSQRVSALLDEMGRRKMTNVLVEGGSRLLGSLLEAHQIDEVHAFIGAKLLGGEAAPSPVGGGGIAQIASAIPFADVKVQALDSDVYLCARRSDKP